MTRVGSDHKPVPIPRHVRVELGLFGLAASVVGAIAMYRGEDGAAPAAIITVGMALVALGLLSPYFQSFKAGGVEIELLQQKVGDAAHAIERAGSKVDEITRIMARSRIVELQITRSEFGARLGPERETQLQRDIDDLQALLDETEAKGSPR